MKKLVNKLATKLFLAISLLGVGLLSASSAGLNTAANPTAQAGQNLLGLIDLMQALVTRVIPLLIGATVVAFFGMMMKYMFSSDGETKGKMWHYMMYAIVVLFVEASIWGLVAFLGSATGIDQGGRIVVPEIPTGVRTYDPATCETRNGMQCCMDRNTNKPVCNQI